MSKGRSRAKCKACGLRKAIFAHGVCLGCYLARHSGSEPWAATEPELPALTTTLLTLDEVDAAFARGTGHAVLHTGGSSIVESCMDPTTGLEVNRLTVADTAGNVHTIGVTGDTWPQPPLAVWMRAEKENVA